MLGTFLNPTPPIEIVSVLTLMIKVICSTPHTKSNLMIKYYKQNQFNSQMFGHKNQEQN